MPIPHSKERRLDLLERQMAHRREDRRFAVVLAIWAVIMVVMIFVPVIIALAP